MTTQLIYQSLATAVDAAIKMSKESGYAAIILSKGTYYVETDTPFIRTWEELIGTYENGELIN